jgi:hypothetical protein
MTMIPSHRRSTLFIALLLFSAVFLVSMSMAASPALASIIHYADPQVVGINGEKIVINYTTEGHGANSGGPFQATLKHADKTTNVWQTFCVEAGNGKEVISLGSTYKVWSVDLNVASNTGNFVTDAAKWLYFQSLHNPSLLEGYTPGNLTSDSFLQEAIWHGVWLKNTHTPLNTHFTGSAVTWFNAAVDAVTAGWADANLVWVMNPVNLKYKGRGSQAQSLLYETTIIQDVPEPSTLVLLGAGALSLLACAWRGRTRNA